MNPYFELKKAIVAKLKATAAWRWPISGDVDDPGRTYMEITDVTSVDASVKKGPIRDFMVSFDTWDLNLTANMGTDEDIMEILYVMETVITLDNHLSGLTPLTLSGGFVDVSHLPFSGPEITPNPDRGIRHARQIIKFKLALPTGG